MMIERFTSGVDFESFREDPKTIAAVERKLLVISEAAIRLGEQAAVLCPDQPGIKYADQATGSGINTSASTSRASGERGREICRCSKPPWPLRFAERT